MNQKNQHPSLETLHAFGAGKLDPSHLRAVSKHIEDCPQCLKVLDQAKASDTLLEQLKSVGSEHDAFLAAPSVSGAAASSDLASVLGDQSKYEVLGQIGSGGMGAVYLAKHKVMGREVAIKVIRPEFVANEEAILRFHNEVQAAAKLTHRNIVAAFDAERFGNTHFLVMEYVQGESLTQIVKRKGQLSEIYACNYVLQVARALKHSDEQGMIHRDIKPSNLMRTPKGVVKVLDFGLARMTGEGDADHGLTSTGVLMGTVDFISPEQARDAKTADIRSDLYSLGCTLYFLLAGTPPFNDSTRVDKIISHCSRPVPDILSLRNDVNPEVAKIISTLTAKDPGDRYQTPQELVKAIEPFGRPRKHEDSIVASQGNTTIVSQQEKQDTEIGPTEQHVSTGELSTGGLIKESPAEGSASSKTKPRRKTLLTLLVLTLLGAVGVGYAFWPPGNEEAGIENQVEQGASAGPRVLAVINTVDFWFSDYGPLEKRLAERGLELVTTSSRSGTARFDPADSDSENKHNVEIAEDIHTLVESQIASKINAVVFIGNPPDEFLGADQVGQAVKALLVECKSKGVLIASIGKGMNIPIHHGAFDDVEICGTDWVEVSENPSFRMLRKSIHFDRESNVLTARSWKQADRFADAIVNSIQN